MMMMMIIMILLPFIKGLYTNYYGKCIIHIVVFALHSNAVN